MLKLYGASGRKYYFFEDEIIKKVQNGSADYMALLPVNRAVRLLKRRLIDGAPGKTIIDANIFTFNELLLKLYNRQPVSKRVIQTETQRLFISTILKKHKDEFNFFPVKPSIPESSVVKIADIVAELRRFGYSAERFKKIKLDASSKKNDFYLLLKYLEEMLYPSLIDEPFALFKAAANLNNTAFFNLFPLVKDVYISGYELFTPAMIRFVQSAKEWLNIHLKFTYNATNEAAFRHVKEAWDKFSSSADEIITEQKLTPLAQYLFTHTSAVEKVKETATSYFIHKVKNRKEEIEFIAALARQLNRGDHIPLHRIAVTFANLDRYVPLIRTVFAEHNLPFNLSTGFKLNQSPLVQTFINLLKFIASGFESRKALELINNRFIIVENRLALAGLFKYLARYRIEYLTDGNMEKLELRMRFDKVNDDEINLIPLLKNFLTPFKSFTQKGTITQMRNTFIILLKENGLLDWYKNEAAQLTEREREREFRAYNRFMKTFDKFIWSYTQTGSSQTVELKDFIRLLQSQVSNALYNLAEKSDYGVQINPRLEVQALAYDVLIVGGLVDGEFPRESVKDIFFNDGVRKKMGLIATENLFDQDRFIFYSLLDSNAQKVYLTYPQYDGERILAPSTFVADFLELYPHTFEDINFDENYLLNEKIYRYKLGKKVFKGGGSISRAINVVKILIDLGGDSVKVQLHNVLRCMEAQRQRVGGGVSSIYEGVLTGCGNIEEVLHKKYDNTVWSASRLEEYAFCPMKFFFSQILRVEEWPEVEEEFTPLERGNLLHTILYRFYSEITNKNRPADYETRLLDIAREELRRLPYDGFFADLEEIRYCGSGIGDGFLSYFLNYDQQQISESGYTPAHFELAFGGKTGGNSDPASSSVPLTMEDGDKKLRIQGRIDRIDINPKGGALIFDYKTGTSAKSYKPSHVTNGLIFQLPLYMSALPYLLEHISADYGGYYIIKDKNECKRHALIADKNSAPPGKPTRNYLPNNNYVNEDGEKYTLDEALALNLKKAIRLGDDITMGNFRHSLFPDDLSCKSYCGYRRMCQKNTAKMKRIAAAGKRSGV